LSFQAVEFDKAFWTNKFRNALECRKMSGILSNENNMFRLIHGEGDGLPGLIADVYDKVIVLQPHVAGYDKFYNQICEALTGIFPNTLKSIYLKPHTDHANKTLWGETISSGIALENGIRFAINWETGQKTGFFIDQRENRKTLAKLSEGKTVLNTFCYTGGFSLYALKGGATEVVSVDSSETALNLLEENLKLNGFEKLNHQSIKADVLEYLKNEEKSFDIIVLDPPAFAKNTGAKHKAVQAYKRLNEIAIRKIKKGGLIFTFSCSQVVDKDLFLGAVTAAGINAGRQVRIIAQLHQPADHPVNLFHTETEYLKGLILCVD
jgi:23S rRNA (cytosine1962-C5)-methyltransferase